MIKFLSFSAFALLLIILSAGCTKDTVEFYVATDGSDSNPGTIDRPFATLGKARNSVREIIRKGLDHDMTVYFREGIYTLDETVVFTLEDGGGETWSITYRAYPGERPVFSSGLPLKAWQKPSEYPDDLPGEAHGRVWVTDLPKELGAFKVMYDGEKLLPRARSEGFNSTRPETSRDRIFLTEEEKKTIYFPHGALKNWKNMEDIEILAWPSVGWTMNILPLAEVDEKNGIAETTIPATYSVRYIKGDGDLVIPKGMYVENVIEYLDQPGEWVVNTLEGKVWYWPEKGEPGEHILVPLLKELVRVEGEIDIEGPVDTPVKNFHFIGLTFIHGERDTWEPGDKGVQHDWEMADKATALLRFRGAEKCSVEECRFASSGGTGLRLDLYCQEISVTSCLFEDLGTSGVLLCGYGPGTKDVNKNNRVSNNRFTRLGKLYWHGQALLGFQTGNNLISHNTFKDLPRKAVGMSGVRTKFFNREVLGNRECASTIRVHEVDWESIDRKRPADITNSQGLVDMWEVVEPYYHTKNNIIEFNWCENVLSMGSDGAAINFTASGRGNIVRNNFVYNTFNPQTSGMRLDGHVRGTKFYNNILFNAHGYKPKPPENETYNNIFIFTEYLSDLEDKEQCLMFEGDVEGRIVRNVFYYRKDFNLPVDRAKVSENPVIKLDSNVYYCAEMEEEAWKMLREFSAIGYESHGLFADPLFMDIDNLDFRLHENSPLKELGFMEVTLDGIGIREDYPEWLKPKGE